LSYLAQSQLETDGDFQRRVYSVNVQQANTYKDDARPAFVAVAEAILRDEPGPGATLLRLDAAGPGIADKVDNGDGTIDQSQVTDDDLLSLTQANWQVVAGLYFDPEGVPLNVA
jgi:hypothetical protein